MSIKQIFVPFAGNISLAIPGLLRKTVKNKSKVKTLTVLIYLAPCTFLY